MSETKSGTPKLNEALKKAQEEANAVAGGGTSDDGEANARLIAAAPDGYAAAKDMLESARGAFGDDIGTYPAQWREQLRALSAFVAKAEGKS